MKACGLIVEYNPYHFGHQYHVNKAREQTNADCMIAVMSGSFLQRGEPAIIDKIHRTKAAIASGVDLVIELPYAYAVQASDFFAKGAILSLAKLQINALCFGSEIGHMDPFLHHYETVSAKKEQLDITIRQLLKQGLSYPAAYDEACKELDIIIMEQQPNNILGNSYVQFIQDNKLAIDIHTIKRIHNNYHDEFISHSIASATSIRKHIFEYGLTDKIAGTLPESSLSSLRTYDEKAKMFHHWEDYFPYIRYRLVTSTLDELAQIHSMDEGLENRMKKNIEHSLTFADFIHRVKTKRYTTVRIQRALTHLLTNTKKTEIHSFVQANDIPYIRVLGFNQKGKHYLHNIKKQLDVPLYANLTKGNANALALEERASHAYYSPLQPRVAKLLRIAELQLPLQINNGKASL